LVVAATYCLSGSVPNNVRTLFGNKTVEIRGAADAVSTPIENVSMDHRRPNVTVAQEFLYGTDVVARFDPVCRERMPEPVRRHAIRQFNELRPFSSLDALRCFLPARPTEPVGLSATCQNR